MTQNATGDKLGKALLAARTSDDASVLAQHALPGGAAPEGVIYINDAETLAVAVKWARETGRPLVPVSSAAPHYQAASLMPRGAFVADFSSMKRVLNINRRNRVAMFEAGVTFEQLVPLLRAHGLRVMLPLIPRLGKSALASYLDREPSIYPKYQWDMSDPLLCLELVYGTGDLFRTGSAAGPGSIEEQWAAGEFQKSPMGPGQNDWMKLIQGAQGTIGLATWCSAKCEVRPALERLFLAACDDLRPLVEASYRMLYRKLTDIHFILDGRALVDLVAKTPEQREEALCRASAWNLIYSVSGIEHFPEERAGYLARESEKELTARGVKLKSPPLIDEADLLKALLHPNQLTAEEKNRLQSGIPLVLNWRDRSLGSHRRVYFQTTLDKVAGFISRFDRLAEQGGIQPQRISRYVQPQLGGRCAHLEFVIAVDPEGQGELAVVQDFCDQVAAPLIEAGAFFSRPHGAWAKPAMAKASSSYWVYERMKDIFDPDHILAPGRLTLGEPVHDG